MKQPKTTTSGVATLFSLVPVCAGELRPACPHGVAAMPRHLQRTPLSGRLQSLLESKYCIAILLLSAMFLSAPAKAVDPYELQIYGYATQGKGVFSPQLLNSFVPYGRTEGDGGTSGTFASQSMMRTAIELEYGLTKKIDFATYLNFARPAGEDVQFAGAKARLRGRFAEKGVLPIDLGWYIELEQWQRSINGDVLELEFKPTMQKDIGRVSIIANFPFEKS